MPFPPNTQRAADIATAQNLRELCGQTLLLMSYTSREARSFGGPICRLTVVDVDGVKAEVYTTSRIVAEQLETLEEHLPLLIVPKFEKGYLSIL